MQVDNILFDLDGTLVDSVAGIEYAIQTAVATVLPNRELPSLKMFIGPPIRELLKQVLSNVEPEALDEIIIRFREIYDRDGWQQSIAYEGVLATLEFLHQQQIPSWIVTNKPILPTCQILDRLEMSKFFTGIFSPDCQVPHFRSKTTMVDRVITEYQLDPAATLFVGDSHDDALAANSNNLRFAWASYGYGNIDINELPVTTNLSRFIDLLDCDGLPKLKLTNFMEVK